MSCTPLNVLPSNEAYGNAVPSSPYSTADEPYAGLYQPYRRGTAGAGLASA